MQAGPWKQEKEDVRLSPTCWSFWDVFCLETHWDLWVSGHVPQKQSAGLCDPCCFGREDAPGGKDANSPSLLSLLVFPETRQRLTCNHDTEVNSGCWGLRGPLVHFGFDNTLTQIAKAQYGIHWWAVRRRPGPVDCAPDHRHAPCYGTEISWWWPCTGDMPPPCDESALVSALLCLMGVA